MAKMISLKRAILIAALASILVGSAVAAVLMTKHITSNMRMLGACNFALVREDDNSVEITNIQWGDFMPLESKDSQTILGTRINIKNLGNINLVFAWNVTGLDTNQWSLTCTWGGNPYPQNDFNQFYIDPGHVNGYLVFTLTSLDAYAPPGDFGFTINFMAQALP